MHVFIINDRVIVDILNNLTLEDKVKDIIKNTILKFDYNYINYIYTVFSVYTTYYFSIVDENSHLNFNDVNEICSKFNDKNINIDIRNIFMADAYDILYASGGYEKCKFKHFFYEDMFNRLVNLIGEENANLHMEEIFETLETIFGSIEETTILGLIKSENITELVIVYTEINNNCLMLYVL